jgi:hypothetical protein
MAGPVSLFRKPGVAPLSWREPKVHVKGVHWRNAPIWLARTVYQDLKHYQHEGRPVTVERLRATVAGNVREPIFILGAPRSGTDFLGDCISALKSVSYHREPVVTKAAVKHIFHKEWPSAQAEAFYRAVYRGLLALHVASDLRFAEKTPRNCFIVPFLGATFPDAAFIHIIRDGRDAALSYSEKPWVRQVFAVTRRRDPSGQLYGPFAHFWTEPERIAEFESTSDLHRAAWTWRAHVETALEGLASLPSDRCLEVRYEDLMAKPLQVGDRILDFLRINARDERIAFQAVLHRADPRSVGRHRKLDSERLRQVEREAGSLLRRLGYVA